MTLLIDALYRADPRCQGCCDWGNDKEVDNLKRVLARRRKAREQTGYAKFKGRLRLSSAARFGDPTSKLEPPFPLWIDTFRPELEGKRWYHRFSALTAKAGGFDLKRDVLTGHGPLGARSLPLRF